MGGLSACPFCGTVLGPEETVCPQCGRPVASLKAVNVLESNPGPRTDVPLSANPSQSGVLRLTLEKPTFLPERYEVQRLLGHGGMGAVYLCHDKQLDRPVAIKIMTDKFRASAQGETRFMREARAQAIVNHTNVSTILNFGVSPDGKCFLVMEYLEGEDLRQFMRRQGRLDPLLSCELMRQACEGLQEAHVCGLVHRDLKPSNLMIVKDHKGQPWVKILDLGLAKIVGGQTDLMTITLDTAAALIGTPAYMSPEQVAGSTVDCRADLYSIGVVFYEMLAGRLPFESESLSGWLYQHLHEMPLLPSAHNPDLAKYPRLEKLTMAMLAKHPEDRPQSAAEIVVTLKSVISGKPGTDILYNDVRRGADQAGASGGQTAADSGSRKAPGSGTSPAISSGRGSGGGIGGGISAGSPSRAQVKISSVPAADRSRPVPPPAGNLPGNVTRRPFSGGAIVPKLPASMSGGSARMPGIVRAPASGGPAAALARFSNPTAPVRTAKSGLYSVSAVSGLEPDQALKMYRETHAEALKCQTDGNWKEALKDWLRVQALAEMYPGLEQAQSELKEARRQVNFEEALGKSAAAAAKGDWQNADEILTQIAGPVLESRLEQARVTLPPRLVAAWLALAAARIRALPEGDLRRDLSVRYTVICAASGDMPGAINFLDASPRKPEIRIVSLSQALVESVRRGRSEGLRPYIERLKNDLGQVADPAERGKASLEVGRAFAVYGDIETAGQIFRDASKYFSEALAQGIPISVADVAQNSDTRPYRPAHTQSLPSPSASGKFGSPAKIVRSSWLAALGALADAQAEAGLIDDCLKTASQVDDPWTKALMFSQLVQSFTRAGRHELAERQTQAITFALPKTQALRAIAISKVYLEDLVSAEEILAAISTPAEQLPIYGVLAVYHALRKDPTRPRTLIANLLMASKKVNGSLPRFNALCAAAEPMLSAGFNDMARSVVDEAMQMIPSVDDPAERLRCILHLCKLKEQRRDPTQSTTRTISAANKPATHLIDPLRQALFTARQLRNGQDRLGCLEALGIRVAAANVSLLSTELLNAFRDEQDQAAIYIGLAGGMI